MGFLFNAIWGILIAIAILRSPLFASWRWIGWVGLVFSIGILGNPLSDLSLNFVPTTKYYFTTNLPVVNVFYLISYSLWTIWLIIPAIRLLLLRSQNVAVQEKLAEAWN